MAEVNVIILLGQSNAEGFATTASLPLSLRGPQANTFVFNFDNNAREILNCDGVGLNLPNNNTTHVLGFAGPEMSLCAAAVADLGGIELFKFAVAGTPLGPYSSSEWNVPANDLIAVFAARWNAYVAVLAGLGHTPKVKLIVWYQGETDANLEGNDAAYFGLFKPFIAAVRSTVLYNVTPYLIRWVTCVIPNNNLLPTVSATIHRINNIRGAQYRAGWDDPEYRIVDTNRFSHTTDLVHLDTEGIVDCGEAIWEAYLLDYNNSMALENYDLVSLRTRLAEEFGIDTSIGANVTTIDRRINDAISWIVNRRKNWPWLEREISLDVGERSQSVVDSRYGAGVFSVHQSQVFGCTYSLNPLAPREVVDFDGRGHEGLIIQSASGTNAQLRHAYRGDAQICSITALTVGNPTIITVNLTTTQGGTAALPTNVTNFYVAILGATHSLGTFVGTHLATRINATQFSIPINSAAFVGIVITNATAQIAKEFRIAQAYFELPEDFIRSSTLHTDEDVEENTMLYRVPTTFEREVRANRLATIIDRIYSVVVDPLNLSSRKYLALYPYFNTRNVLHLKYFGDAKKLVADSDVPDVPRSDRFVVWYASAWFVAQWQKDATMIPVYRDSALNELERMTKEYQLSNDITEHMPADSGASLGPVRGPDGFPEFEEP